MQMEEVPLIRLDSRLTQEVSSIQLASFPSHTPFPLFHHRVTYYSVCVCTSPSCGAVPFWGVLPTSYLLLCCPSSHTDETVG